MKLKSLVVTLGMVLVPLALFWGCNKAGQPVSPANGSSLNVSLSGKSGSLLLASQNTLLYVVSGPGVPSISGILGPVSSSSLSGGYSFSIPLSSAKYNLISLELENAVSFQAMDIGAMALSGSSNASVTMGPLNKSCYSVSSFFTGYSYGFEDNTLTFEGADTPTTLPGIDLESNPTSNGLGYELDNPALTNSTVAYMGNGNFVNYLTVPPDSSFSRSSSLSKKTILGGGVLPVAVGDVYCIKMKAGGYAWLQITNAGIVGISGPSLVFRVNTTVPYCGYEQTTADLAGLAVNGTPTPYAPLASSAAFSGNIYGIAVYPSTSAALSIFASNDQYVQASGTSGTANVQVLDPTSLAASATFATGNWAQGLAVNSTGTTIYVAVTYPPPGGLNPTSPPVVQMYSLPNLNLIGAAGAGTSITGSDNTVQASAADMDAPEFLAVSPITPFNVFVTDSGTNDFADVMVLQGPTTIVGRAATSSTPYWNGQIGTSTSPAGIATDGTTVYVADSGHNQIETYTVNGVPGSTWTTDNNPAGAVPFSGPQGIALNSALGELFIADTNNNRVVEMTTAGVFKAAWGPSLGTSVSPATFNLPVAIAVDGATPPNVFVADSANKRVLKFLGL